jgi:hypothetical protein
MGRLMDLAGATPRRTLLSGRVLGLDAHPSRRRTQPPPCAQCAINRAASEGDTPRRVPIDGHVLGAMNLDV